MIQWSDFFKIISLEGADNNYVAVIEFNPLHEIFEGHFPGKPVVPGVCMLQIIKDILKNIYKKDFTMKQASQLKFLAVVNPNENKTLTVNLTVLKQDAAGITVSGSFNRDQLVFMKYKIIVAERF
jgi:3-hydroxyacyl-[acyl-carrier-protein] dehydratase